MFRRRKESLIGGGAVIVSADSLQINEQSRNNIGVVYALSLSAVFFFMKHDLSSVPRAMYRWEATICS